jgi:hypothetical protein
MISTPKRAGWLSRRFGWIELVPNLHPKEIRPGLFRPGLTTLPVTLNSYNNTRGPANSGWHFAGVSVGTQFLGW